MSEERDTRGPCAWSARLGAFHDGELTEHDAALVTAHLEECPQCRRELAELQRLSRIISAAGAPGLDPAAVRKMAGRAFARSAVPVRMARVLTACAAAMLIIFSIFALAAPAERTQAADFEAAAAAASLDEPGELAIEPDYEFASWIVADLSGGN